MPDDSLCILPKNEMCDSLNKAMLNRINSEEIELIAKDDIVTVLHNLRNKIKKILEKDEDISRTAGLAKIITIKIGARVMIRRNIDTSIGLCNCARGKVISISKNLTGEIETVNVEINGQVHNIKKVNVEFEICKGVHLSRSQFPFILSYAISIHKSQGISLNSVLIDAGEHNFADGQIYVALSRVTSLAGLHLINFDPSEITANENAIKEYNKLRIKYKPGWPLINICKTKPKKIKDQIWTVPKRILQVQDGDQISEQEQFQLVGLKNYQRFDDYANVAIQILFHSTVMRHQISLLQQHHTLKITLNDYASGNLNNLINLKQFGGEGFTSLEMNNADEFLSSIIGKCSPLKEIVHNKISTVYHCSNCNQSVTKEVETSMLILYGYNDKSYDLQEIINLNLSEWISVKMHCQTCNNQVTQMKMKKFIRRSGKILIIKMISIDLKNKDSIFVDYQYIDNSLDSIKNGELTKGKVKGIPTFKMKLGNFNYHVISAFLLQKNFKEQFEYSCLIKNIKSGWTHIKDDLITSKTWPRNSKDVCTFILEAKTK